MLPGDVFPVSHNIKTFEIPNLNKVISGKNQHIYLEIIDKERKIKEKYQTNQQMTYDTRCR